MPYGMKRKLKAYNESIDRVGSKNCFQLFVFYLAKVRLGPVFSVGKLTAGSYLFYTSFDLELCQVKRHGLFLIGGVGADYGELLFADGGQDLCARAAFGGAENQG